MEYHMNYKDKIKLKISQMKFKVFADSIIKDKKSEAKKKQKYAVDKDIEFVIFLPAADCYFYQYYDLMDYSNVDINISISNFNLISPNLNKVLRKNYYNGPINGKIKYFIFVGQYGRCTKDFRKYLKEKYPKCRIVFVMGDLMKTHGGLNLEEFRSFSDIVLTYDEGDAIRYGFTSYDGPYTKIHNLDRGLKVSESDIVFCGYCKDRVNFLIDLYDKLSGAGLTCDFNIPDLKREYANARKPLAGGTVQPYLEHLKRVQKSKCILDIVQKGADGFDVRVWEAVVYQKKLITNNRRILSASFYNPRYISVVDSVDEVDPLWINEKIKIDYMMDDTLMPVKWLEFIVRELK